MNLVITGMGAVTPIGIGVPEYWKNLVAGCCGIGAITRFNTENLPVHIAAEVHFDAEKLLPRNLLRNTDRFTQFAFLAAQEALQDSTLNLQTEGDHTGLVMGTAMGGIAAFARTQDAFSLGKIHKAGPHLVPSVLGNSASAQIAIANGLHGVCFTVGTACSSGGDAIMLAALLLQSGEADVVLAVGGESILTPLVISSLAQAKAISRANTNEASRPFDLHRDGFVIGEGGGALVLEGEEHALARHAAIKARISGYANTADGYHITAPDPSGKGAIHCMAKALQRTGLALADIGYINAHGTSTPLGDKMETQAIRELFGSDVPPVSSTKGATGHLMGAGGLTEVIACVQALREGILPPTLHYKDRDPQCDLDYIPNTARKVAIHAAMSNSFGFGGQNSTIITEKYEE